MPSWRQNSMVRTLTSSILAGLSLFSRSSTSSVATPRRPRSAASASPIGTAAGDQHGRFAGESGCSLHGGLQYQAASNFRSLVVQYSQARAIGRGSRLNAPAFWISTGVRVLMPPSICASRCISALRQEKTARNTISSIEMPDHGRAVPSHQDNPMGSQRARERLSLLRLWQRSNRCRRIRHAGPRMESRRPSSHPDDPPVAAASRKCKRASLRANGGDRWHAHRDAPGRCSHG